MARVWYCVNCGYEVRSKGRCFNCGDKLVASALAELEPLAEEDEVGYRLDGWEEADRGRLIAVLNSLGVLHRFEDEELVVAAEDESRVDDLVSSLADGIDLHDGGDLHDSGDGVDAEPGEDGAGTDEDADGEGGAGEGGAGEEVGDGPSEEGEGPSEVPAAVREAVALLASAADRLHADPTDMQADGDVAEASAAVFMTDSCYPLDEDSWSAVGRVTRQLLALLGADEALEDEIREQAAVLRKLLEPVTSGGVGSVAGGAAPGVRTVYELPEWLPEQRAHLGVLMDQAGVSYSWDGDELLVPSDREEEVEALFGRVGGVDDGDESEEEAEARYEAVAELFAASGRLAGDPADADRRAAVVDWFERSDGPPLLGMDDTDWYRIVNRAKSLVALIEEEGDLDRIQGEADDLHGLLRSVV